MKLNSPFKLSPSFEPSSKHVNKQQRLYVIVDPHGHAEELEQIMLQIKNDMTKYPDAEFDIVIGGDLVDRGPHSKSVIEALAKLKATAELRCKIIILKGNHDVALVHFLSPMRHQKDFEDHIKFLANGGATTLASYGVFLNPQNAPKGAHDWKWVKSADIVEAQKKLNDAMPVHHKALLRSLQIEHWYKPDGIEQGYYICHGGVSPDAPLDLQDLSTRLGLDYKKSTSRHFTKYEGHPLQDSNGQKWVVIHGHTIIGNQPQITDSRISVDTGCFKGGHLSCVVIVDGQYDKTIQYASLYPPFDANHIPQASNWPPQKNPTQPTFGQGLLKQFGFQ